MNLFGNDKTRSKVIYQNELDWYEKDITCEKEDMFVVSEEDKEI